MFIKHYYVVVLVILCVKCNAGDISHATEFLQCAHQILRNGVWDWDLPSFDPLVDERPFIDFDSLQIPNIISGRLNMAYGIVEGIPYFTIKNLSETLTNNSVDIQTTLGFNRLAAHTEYKGKIYLFNKVLFYGDGIIKLEVFDSHVDAHFIAEYNKQKDKWSATRFDFVPNIGSAKVKLTGLYNNATLSKEITEIVQQNGVDFFNRFSGLFNVVFSIAMRIYLNLTMTVSQERLKEVLSMMFDVC